MSRDLRSSSLLGSDPLGGNDLDPMESMGNLMDVMLVFACGLLLALIAHWNVDVNNVNGSAQASMVAIDESLQEAQEGADEISDEYTEVGTVYRDDDTGEMYLVM